MVKKPARELAGTNPKTWTLEPQAVESHSGHTALKSKFKGGSNDAWPGAGWNWWRFSNGTLWY